MKSLPPDWLRGSPATYVLALDPRLEAVIRTVEGGGAEAKALLPKVTVVFAR